MIFGAIGLSELHPSPASVAGQESTIAITLVAAPAEPAVVPEAPRIEPVVPTPVALPPPELIPPVVAKPAEPSVPAQTTLLPQQPTEISKPTPPPQIQTKVRGDGTSPQPGLDATTQKAEVSVRAEPTYGRNPEPPYPLLARRRHQEGLVVLGVRVTTQGRAAAVALKKSSGFPLLDEAAIQAVRDWEFQPARVGSTAVESDIEVPVRFRLSE